MLASFAHLRVSSAVVLTSVLSAANLGAAAKPVAVEGCCGRCAAPAHPAAAHPAAAHPAAVGFGLQPVETWSDPYPLDVCPVRGSKLGSMGDPVVKTYDGREVRFCCAACIKKFEGDKGAYWKKIDEKIVEAQKPFYPLAECPISGDKLGGMGAPVDLVYNNRLVRFCCRGCVSGLNKDPKTVIERLDKAVIERQGRHYPLTTCVVSGEALGGEMGEAVERVYNNHLVRLCCTGCIREFEKMPAKFLGVLDEAWKKRGGVPQAAPSEGQRDESKDGPKGHDDHDHR